MDRLTDSKAVLVRVKCAARSNLHASTDPNVTDKRSELAVGLNVRVRANLDTAALADFDNCVGFDERAITQCHVPAIATIVDDHPIIDVAVCALT